MLFIISGSFQGVPSGAIQIVDDGFIYVNMGSVSGISLSDIEVEEIQLGNVTDSTGYNFTNITAYLSWLNTSFKTAHNFQGLFTLTHDNNIFYITTPQENIINGFITYTQRIFSPEFDITFQ